MSVKYTLDLFITFIYSLLKPWDRRLIAVLGRVFLLWGKIFGNKKFPLALPVIFKRKKTFCKKFSKKYYSFSSAPWAQSAKTALGVQVAQGLPINFNLFFYQFRGIKLVGTAGRALAAFQAFVRLPHLVLPFPEKAQGHTAGGQS
jgi:hypothetical protein